MRKCWNSKRCDNAGENKNQDKHLNEEQLGLPFEYTAVNNPEQNGTGEMPFLFICKNEGISEANWFWFEEQIFIMGIMSKNIYYADKKKLSSRD